MSAEDRTRQMQEQSQALQSQVEQPRKTIAPQENPVIETTVSPNAPKVLVKKIIVRGVTLFSEDKIRAITSKYEDQQLTLQEIKHIASLITALYKQKGYITSRAYVPVQEFENGILEIRVLEARVGHVEIKGNRYFSTVFIHRYVTLQQGDVFNYIDLKRDLQNINEHPDLNVKTVLAASETPGSTDVILNEKDDLPVHVSIGYDNDLSYYLNRNEYLYTLTDNNLLGFGDILTVQYDRAVEAQAYYYYSGNYLYPVTTAMNVGFLYSRSNMVLGRDLASIDSSGESKTYSLYADQKLFRNDDLNIDLTFGFDYKDVDNYLEGALSSRDDLRTPRAGFNIDLADDFGRTVIADEADYGIPGIMGGTKQDLDANDIPTSRAGADGRFFLDTLNLLRFQNLSLGTSLLWKNQLQFSSSILTQTEEFQAGGPANNRGFGPADAVGDEGYAMSWELNIPPYFMPRYYQIPYWRESLYDAFRFIGFYDWTNVHSNAVQPGEDKDTTLGSAGCGARLSILQNFYASYEIAWPLQGDPVDGKHVHQWLNFTLTF